MNECNLLLDGWCNLFEGWCWGHVFVYYFLGLILNKMSTQNNMFLQTNKMHLWVKKICESIPQNISYAFASKTESEMDIIHS